MWCARSRVIILNKDRPRQGDFASASATKRQSNRAIRETFCAATGGLRQLRRRRSTCTPANFGHSSAPRSRRTGPAVDLLRRVRRRRHSRELVTVKRALRSSGCSGNAPVFPSLPLEEWIGSRDCGDLLSLPGRPRDPGRTPHSGCDEPAHPAALARYECGA